jgi:hypothetical protein
MYQIVVFLVISKLSFLTDFEASHDGSQRAQAYNFTTGQFIQ